MSRLIPGNLKAVLPLDEATSKSIQESRNAIKNTLASPSTSPLLVIVGPCSIHDTEAAIEYATRLAAYAERHRSTLLIAMRVYVEKPRTTVGWKGLVHDPDLKQSTTSDLAKGLYVSREIMLKVASMGLPVVTEILSLFTMPFFEDLLASGVIGARTTESQPHRELVSDLALPVGFKNGTDGSLGVAIDAMKASARPHTLISVDDEGYLNDTVSAGNEDTFVVLRGGKSGPNYSPEDIRKAEDAMRNAGQDVKLVVDCSHGNSSKDYRRQSIVAGCVAKQVAAGVPIVGVMLESNINAGRQDIKNGLAGLEYGVSVTDGCISWEETEKVLDELAAAVTIRQAGLVKTPVIFNETKSSLKEKMTPTVSVVEIDELV